MKWFDLSGKVALVTGGNGGIGLGMARGLAQAGAQVMIAGRDAAKSERAVAELVALGAEGDAIVADVSQEGDARSTVPRTVERFGRLDILVNNAGITRDSTLHRMGHDSWQAVIDTNLGGCFNLCRCVIDGMRERAFGRIVNIGSINGQAGQYGQVNYAAAKSGIHGFTKALAQEGASKHITVNAIAPGYVDTEMVRAVPPNVLEKIIARIPVGRLGHAPDIARGVLFLVADDADFITGSTLSINGGQHMY